MDELQARLQAFQAQQTGSNPTRQPAKAMEPPNKPLHSALADEANPGEFPEPPAVAPEKGLSPTEGYTKDAVVKRSTSKRKSQTAAKRKSQTLAKTVVPVPFRQLRGETQQPYADELKRLEAQAERINQLLAEQAQKKVQQRLGQQMGQQIVNGLPNHGIPIPSNDSGRSSHAALPSPRRHSTRPSQQTHSPSPGDVIPMATVDDEAETKRLQAQANRINELLAELEATIRQTNTIPPPPQASPSLTEPLQEPGHATPDLTPEELRQSPTAIPPLTRGQEQITSLRQDLYRANQEAEETAQALRSLASREQPIGALEHPASRQNGGHPRSVRSGKGKVRSKRFGFRVRQLLQVPAKPMDRLGDAALWIVLAAVARLGSRVLLMGNPVLTPIVVGLMLAPAALAVYLALFVPKAGFVSIYRLFLITLGLLLGSKL